MKKIIILIFVCFSFYNCSNKYSKENFIGIWDDRPTGFHNQIQFYQDSVVSWSYCKKFVGTWTVDSSKIYFHYPKSKGIPGYNEYSYFDYRFNSAKDSIYVIVEGDTLEHLLLKVDDFWKHYLKEYNLKIDLPKVNQLTSLIKIKDYEYPEIYIGWQNGAVTIKGSSNKTLKTNNDYATSLLNDYMSLNINKNTHPITLVVDKSISKKDLDSIKRIINNLKLDSTYFFKVYDFDEGIKTNYGNVNLSCSEKNWYWYGLYDWNGLDQN
ncbi:MAG: hypothetical protein JXQ93_04075 [Flavobacteriaceae bacterium]